MDTADTVISCERMLRLFGPVQLLMAEAEPSHIADLAVDMPINYSRGSQHHCSFGFAPHTNMAIFVLLFTVCAFEVIFVKILSAIRDGMSNGNSARSDHYLTPEDHDNNNSVLNAWTEATSVRRDAWHWLTALQQNIQQTQPMPMLARPPRFISTQTFLQRMAQATAAPFDDNNNSNHNNNNIYH